MTTDTRAPRGRWRHRLAVTLAAAGGAVLLAVTGCGSQAARGAPSVATDSGASVPVRPCASLSGSSLAGGTVTSARATAATKTTPGYCNVQVTVANGPAGNPVHVGVFLPTATWNGSFMGTGGGGYVGGDPSTPCAFIPQVVGQPCALEDSYVTAGTDAGHVNVGNPSAYDDGSWALNPDQTLSWPRIDDFGYLGIHEMTTTAKAVIAKYYGRGPRYSFFNGGSNGGRQALTEAQRYPADYNGIAAASPAVNWTEFMPALLWGELLMNWSHDFIPQAKFTAVNDAAIAACDSLDGVKDGIISDWQDCRYDARTAVGKATSAGTISAADATIIDKMWQGPRGPHGQFLWYGYEPGADFASFAGTTTVNGVSRPAASALATQWFKYWLTQNPGFSWQTLTYDQYVKLFRKSVAEFGSAMAADNPNLTAFRNDGGKLVIWHGTYDPLIPTAGSVDYWNRLVAAMGGSQRTEGFARFFIAPGAGHVASAAGPAPLGAQGSAPQVGSAIGAVVNWVEKKKAPTQLLGVTSPAAGAFNTDGKIAMTRPVCLYPLVARYQGHGSTNVASSFTCSAHF